MDFRLKHLYTAQERPLFTEENGLEKFIAYLLEQMQEHLVFYEGENKVHITRFHWKRGNQIFTVEESEITGDKA